MVQGVDAHGDSLGWTSEPEEGPYTVVEELAEAYEALNIPTDDDLNPEVEFAQNREFFNCNNQRMVSVPIVHDETTFSLGIQRSCLSRTGSNRSLIHCKL